jgi:hypothetical protein
LTTGSESRILAETEFLVCSQKTEGLVKKLIIVPLWVAFCAAVLTSCSGSSVRYVSLSRVLNVARIETILNEDGSGRNNFWLVVPGNSTCPLVDLQPALESITSPTRPLVVRLDDDIYKGYKVTFEFDNADQIPAQIQSIKSTVVNAVIAATPTPAPPENPETPIPTVIPAQASGLYYNENQLSIKFTAPTTELTGQKWSLQVTVNPFLMSGLIAEEMLGGLGEKCSIPTFTYQLSVSNKMRINDFAVESQPNLAAFSNVRRISANSIEWTIESKQAFDVITADLLTALSTPEPDPTALQQQFEYPFTGQIYKLTVNATTPNPWFTFLTGVVAPLLGLLAVSFGLFTTLRNLRKKKGA